MSDDNANWRSKNVGVHYWMQDDETKNFGDFLAEWLLAHIFDQPKGRFSTIFLVGSVIADYTVDVFSAKALADAETAGRTEAEPIAFWACGLREPLPLRPDNAARSRFFGCRGPLSRDVLGLGAAAPIGDPGLLLAAFYTPRASEHKAGKKIAVPHILDPKPEETLISETGVDLIVSPRVANDLGALEERIDNIASASLVLAGSLHAAITACAYGVPFAFLNTGHLDCPFKWLDFAASVGCHSDFVRNVAEYEACIASNPRKLRPPPLAPLLKAAPLSLLPGQLEVAERFDATSSATSGCLR